VDAARSLFNVVMNKVRTPGKVALEICRSSSIVLGKSPVTAEAVTTMSLPSGAPPAPLNEYANVRSSKLPWMHKLTTAEPDPGRVTVSGGPCIPQFFPPVSSPMVSRSIAADSAAVVGSGTVSTMGVAAGCPLESVIVPTEISNGTITNGTGFESAPFGPGFCTWMVSVPADCTSAGFSPVAQLVVAAQVVPRVTPLIEMVEAALPLPATNPLPCTCSGKLSTAPAKTLDGKITSIVGPLVIAPVALAESPLLAWLVAVTVTAFGEGAAVGAV
jgi:hypothetical protein